DVEQLVRERERRLGRERRRARPRLPDRALRPDRLARARAGDRGDARPATGAEVRGRPGTRAPGPRGGGMNAAVQGLREQSGADDLELAQYGAEIERVRDQLAEYVRDAGR